jgi:uncharacterized membrane protein YbaN (DUF454 family)
MGMVGMKIVGIGIVGQIDGLLNTSAAVLLITVFFDMYYKVYTDIVRV